MSDTNTATQTGSILRKRVKPPRPVRRADESTLEQILELEMPRSADKLLALEAAVLAVTQTQMSSKELVESLGDNDLVCLMTQEGQGPGLIVADPSLIAAVIEIQTLGKVSSSPVAERRATRIDVVILSDLIDRWMTDIANAAQALGAAGIVPFFGYTRAPRELSVRAVELLLEPVIYRSVRVSLALGGDAKTGAIAFFVPAAARVSPGAGGRVGSVGQKLEPHIMDAPVVLDAVLDRMNLSLAEVLALEPGSRLSVSRDNIGHVRLEADGALVDSVRLGQFEGMRAVRMGVPDDDLPMARPAQKPMLPQPTSDPDLPEELPELPPLEDAGLPEPAAEEDGALPDLPDLPDLDLGGDGDLPDLPDLPELPDLPDLPAK